VVKDGLLSSFNVEGYARAVKGFGRAENRPEPEIFKEGDVLLIIDEITIDYQ